MPPIEIAVLRCVGEILKKEVNLDTSVKNTPNWDSLKMVQIIMSLDENGIGVPLEKLATVESIRDLVRISFRESE